MGGGVCGAVDGLGGGVWPSKTAAAPKRIRLRENIICFYDTKKAFSDQLLAVSC
jgi:hypothetical protein